MGRLYQSRAFLHPVIFSKFTNSQSWIYCRSIWKKRFSKVLVALFSFIIIVRRRVLLCANSNRLRHYRIIGCWLLAFSRANNALFILIYLFIIPYNNNRFICELHFLLLGCIKQKPLRLACAGPFSIFVSVMGQYSQLIHSVPKPNCILTENWGFTLFRLIFIFKLKVYSKIKLQNFKDYHLMIDFNAFFIL